VLRPATHLVVGNLVAVAAGGALEGAALGASDALLHSITAVLGAALQGIGHAHMVGETDGMLVWFVREAGAPAATRQHAGLIKMK